MPPAAASAVSPTRSAPLLDDQPAPEDLLNFGQFAVALREIILNPQTKTPLIIGVFGRWGTGKTTLLRMLGRDLEKRGVKTVWFSAWLYNQEQEIWAAFLQSLTSRLADRLSLKDKIRFSAQVYRRGFAWSRLLYEAPRIVVRVAIVAAPVLVATLLATEIASKVGSVLLQASGALGTALLAAGALLRPAAEAVRREFKPDFSLYRSMDFEGHIGFLDRFREQFQRIIDSLPGSQRRVVIFVDDLDRCGPEKALQLLDAIKVFLDVPECIFVLGVDIAVIQRAVADKYAKDEMAQKEYLSKIVQLPFHLPPLTEGDLRTYLLGLDVQFPDERCREVFLAALSRNPRELKRVINTYSLHWYLAQARELGTGVTPVRLAKVIVIQQSYASLFGLLRDQPQLLAILERQLRKLTGDEAGGESDRELVNITLVSAPSGVKVPPVLLPFVQEVPLTRLLTMHQAETAEADDASFLHLTPEEIQVYFTLAPISTTTSWSTSSAESPSAAGAAPAAAESIARVVTGDHAPYFGGRYMVLQRIGQGGAGEVFLAEERETRRKVAIKRLSPTLIHDSSWAQRFRREAEALAGFTQHPNIVTLLRIEAEGDPGAGIGPFYVMEYVSGETLDTVLSHESPLPLQRAREVLLPIFDALTHIHAAGMLHRDIKPSAILIGTDGVPRLGDFGLAVTPVEGRDRLTSTGIVLGTPAYRSPEQAKDAPLDARSDLFSFGVVIYECLTGKNPIAAGGTATEILRRLLSDEPVPPPSTVRSELSPKVDRFIERMLASEPSARFENARVARDAFQAAMDATSRVAVP
jgi:Cdc6-like AAA superfamily ATPase